MSLVVALVLQPRHDDPDLSFIPVQRVRESFQ